MNTDPITELHRAECPICAMEEQGKTALQAGTPVSIDERIAVLTAHRAIGNQEQDSGNGKLAGYCAVCQVPWPCEYAGKPTSVQSARITQLETELNESNRRSARKDSAFQGLIEERDAAISERDDLRAKLSASEQSREAMTKADGGLVDQFLNRLLGRLNALGIDASDCNGDDDPVFVVGDWIAGRIKERDQLREANSRLTKERDEKCKQLRLYYENLASINIDRDSLYRQLDEARKELAELKTLAEKRLAILKQWEKAREQIKALMGLNRL